MEALPARDTFYNYAAGNVEGYDYSKASSKIGFKNF
jgi:hypothetical protein